MSTEQGPNQFANPSPEQTRPFIEHAPELTPTTESDDSSPEAPDNEAPDGDEIEPLTPEEQQDLGSSMMSRLNKRMDQYATTIGWTSATISAGISDMAMFAADRPLAGKIMGAFTVLSALRAGVALHYDRKRQSKETQ